LSSFIKAALVLVVEDNPLLLLHAMDVVTEAGLEPVTAANADEAIILLETRTDIRLVFTDIDMPGSMDGLRLAAAVRDRWPPIEIILTSGHAAPRLTDMPARSRFFPKPYDMNEVVRSLRELVAA
jgi:CheY-like chemotaxis protein